MRNEAVNGIDKDDLARAAEDAESAASQGDNAANENALPEYIVLNGVKTEAKGTRKNCGRGCGRQLQFRSH